jgi:predicted 2-oxoglutarate/Fe(II)-dependent dioxygenase YbiX|tara:strand:+ start:1241 stop:1765 length:525 start_codon:yes stop_codon:yes gene_type:complete
MELKANKLYKIVQRKVFTQEECEKIMSVETEPAPFVTYGHMKKLNLLLQNDDNKWIRDRIEKTLLDINKRIYNYKDVYLQNEIGYRIYDENESYDWHTDNFWGQRLSMSITLNDDYEGGQLYIFNGEFLEPKKMVGVMTVWPPFLFHHVSPVTKGKRKTLLTFLQGPRCDVYNK